MATQIEKKNQDVITELKIFVSKYNLDYIISLCWICVEKLLGFVTWYVSSKSTKQHIFM